MCRGDFTPSAQGGPRLLVADGERGVDHVRRDVDRLSGAELVLVLLEPLLDAPLAHPDDLLLLGMAMEGVSLTGRQGDVHDAQSRRPGERRPRVPPAVPPLEALALDVLTGDEPAVHARSLIGMDLKRLMFSVMATSVGRRFMLDAPKNPTTPFVRSMTAWAS